MDYHLDSQVGVVTSGGQIGSPGGGLALRKVRRAPSRPSIITFTTTQPRQTDIKFDSWVLRIF